MVRPSVVGRAGASGNATDASLRHGPPITGCRIAHVRSVGVGAGPSRRQSQFLPGRRHVDLMLNDAVGQIFEIIRNDGAVWKDNAFPKIAQAALGAELIVSEVLSEEACLLA